jgi:hypothetical protein
MNAVNMMIDRSVLHFWKSVQDTFTLNKTAKVYGVKVHHSVEQVQRAPLVRVLLVLLVLLEVKAQLVQKD